MGRDGIHDMAAGFDPSILGPAAVLNLAACHIHLGECERAQVYLGPLLSDPGYKDRAARFYALAERTRRSS